MILRRHKQFVKDWNKTKLNDTHYTKFIKFTYCLIDGKALPSEARDHSLLGEFKEYREFHLGGDMLVIYTLKGDVVTLYRIGTHNKLFTNA